MIYGVIDACDIMRVILLAPSCHSQSFHSNLSLRFNLGWGFNSFNKYLGGAGGGSKKIKGTE